MARVRRDTAPPDLKPRRHGPRYRKVEVALWGDGRFAQLSPAPPNAQTLWLYLLCGWRTTIFPGLVVARPAVLASDLRWPLEGLREALSEVCVQSLIKCDETSGVILLRKALFHGTGRRREDVRETARPESPNVILGWSKSWPEIPDCELKVEYLYELGAFAEALGEGFAKAYRVGFRKALAKASAEAYPHPSSNQDQDQDQDQDQEGREEEPSPSLGTVGDTARADRLAAAERILLKLTEQNGTAYTSPEHIAAVVQRLREGATEHELRAVVMFCANEKGWRDDEKMRANLTPSVLFGSREKLARYLDDARAAYAADLRRIA